jgi:alkylhydroperoxidase family enzyme
MTTPNDPRIPPVERADADERQAELLDGLGPAGEMNIFRTLANHPKLMRSWLPFGGRLLQGSSLPPRDREMVILRAAARCGSDYEWGHHVGIGREAGLTDDEIASLAEAGSGADGRPAWDAALVGAVDELLDDRCVADGTWAALSERYDRAQLIELTMLAGHYAMLAGVLRSAGVRSESVLPVVGEL